MGGGGRCEGTHMRVRLWRQDTRDIAAVQEGRAAVFAETSYYDNRKNGVRSTIESFDAPRTPNLGPHFLGEKNTSA